MRKVAQLLRERAQAYGRIMAMEMGKPLKDGAAEVTKCAWVCEYYAEQAEQHLAPRPEPSDAGRSYVRFDPLGVVLAVMPWNFPFWQVFRFIAPHLMAGNGGVLKHASNVPQCALAIEEVFHDAGFPEALFRTVLIGARRVRAAHRRRPDRGGHPHRQRAGRAARWPPRRARRSRRRCWSWAGRTRSSSWPTPTWTRPPGPPRWPGP